MTWLGVLLFLGAAISAPPLQQQPPARDAVLQPTKGSASVSGTVLNDDDPAQPVRRAIVVLAGAGLRPSRGAITDDAGRFEFAGIPAGRFTITVTRASFITSMYGAKRPGRPGTPISVSDGAKITDLTVRLWRGAAVAGTLRDDTGAPVAGVEVSAIPARSAGSLPTLSNNGVLTNEAGEFRIFGLEPGTYIVAARPTSGGQAQYLAMSDAETDAALEAIRRRMLSVPTLSQTPAVVAAPPALPPPPPQQRPFDYAPIYFPGTAVIGQAAPLTLMSGQAQTGLDFALQRVPTAIVSGVVTKPDGTPGGGASLQLTAVVPPGPFSGSSRLELNATAAPDGTFKIAQVTPGDYQLVARVPVDPKAPGIRPGYIEPPSTAQMFAVSTVFVSGADISGLGLSVDIGVPVSGQFVFQSDAQKPSPPMTGLRVSLIPESQLPIAPGRGISATSLRLPASPVAKPDGTFEFGGVAPGRYQVVIGTSGVDTAGWQLQSATIQGRDVLDGLIDIVPGAPVSLVVTFDDRPTSLSGKLESASGAAASDVFVIAFAADRELWGSYTRRVKAVRPGSDGSFAISGLPAGDYLLAAITDADPEDWQNPAFLEQLVAASVRIRLIGGQPLVQGLRIGREIR
jgi:hypothetical protein